MFFEHPSDRQYMERRETYDNYKNLMALRRKPKNQLKPAKPPDLF
jgi:hypothetical protein